jgi:hypothetical protein
MSQTVNIPFFKAKVRLEYLYNLEEQHGKFEDCYVFAVTAIFNRPLLFHIHTESGAVFSKLPIEALCHIPCAIPEYQVWSALGNSVFPVTLSYLKNYWVQTKFGEGRYMFSLDFFDGGFSEDPEQQKILHMIELESGNFITASNNHCKFMDSHFTVERPISYKRNTHYWVGLE